MGAVQIWSQLTRAQLAYSSRIVNCQFECSVGMSNVGFLTESELRIESAHKILVTFLGEAKDETK